MDSIFRAIDRIIEQESKKEEKQRCNHVSLHGGEPLIIDIDNLEKLFKKIYDFWEGTGIQTNGILITDEHMQR